MRSSLRAEGRTKRACWRETEEMMAVWNEWLINWAVTRRSYMGSSRRIASRSSAVEKTVLNAEGMMTDILMMGIGVERLI